MNNETKTEAASDALTWGKISSEEFKTRWAAVPREEKDRLFDQMRREADERDRASAAENERASQQTAWEKLCPPVYAEEIDFAKLPCDRKLGEMVMQWRFNPTGLLLLGPTGRGKTRLIWHVLSLAHFAGRRIVALDGIQFANDAAAAAYSPEDTEKWMRRMYAPDILFIDDLAKRFTKTSAQLLFGLVERRTSNRKPIMITTNVTAEQLATLINDPELAEPLARRLREFCNPITL